MGGLAEPVTRESLLHAQLGPLVMLLDWIAVAISLLAILIMVIGTARFLIGFLRAEIGRHPADRVRALNAERRELGRYILSALEVLIVSDILHTVISQSLASLLFLGALVAIRSVISYFLDREISELRRHPT